MFTRISSQHVRSPEGILLPVSHASLSWSVWGFSVLPQYNVRG